MEDWNREQKEREEEESWRSQHKEEGETKELSGEEESDIDSLIRKTAEKEQDYSNMTPREINNLIDQALDEGDFEKVKMLSGYLPKESAQIYLRELERINEL
jgi:ferritin